MSGEAAAEMLFHNKGDEWVVTGYQSKTQQQACVNYGIYNRIRTMQFDD